MSDKQQIPKAVHKWLSSFYYWRSIPQLKTLTFIFNVCLNTHIMCMFMNIWAYAFWLTDNGNHGMSSYSERRQDFKRNHYISINEFSKLLFIEASLSYVKLLIIAMFQWIFLLYWNHSRKEIHTVNSRKLHNGKWVGRNVLEFKGEYMGETRGKKGKPKVKQFYFK